MKIVLFFNRDVYCNVVANELVAGLGAHDVSAYFTEKVGRAPTLEPLDQLTLIEHDLPYQHVFPGVDGEGNHGELLTDEAIQRGHGIRFSPMPDPNDAAAQEELRALSPDLVVSVRYGRIFKADVLAIPTLGVLNLHSGLLPHYRGVMATFRALLRGDQELGCTLHFIDDPSIDTGPVVAEWRRAVDSGTSYFGHVLSLYPPGAQLILDAIGRLGRGETLASRPQAADKGAYYSFPNEDDVAAFEHTGYGWFRAAEIRALFDRYRST